MLNLYTDDKPNYDGTYDSRYPNGDKPFLPLLSRNFNDGVVGESAQSEFNSGGATAVYDDTNPLNGNYINSTALVGSENSFDFGGWLTLDRPLVNGDEIWYQVSIRPTDEFWTDSNPHLKFMRVRENDAEGAGSGYADLYIEGTIPGDEGKIKFIKEGPAQWLYSNAGIPTLNQWNKYEFYLKLGATSETGHVRVWKDNNLILDQAAITMNNTDGECPMILLFTYWNGEPAVPTVNHTVGIDSIIVGTNRELPPNFDVSGNRFIGDYTP